MVIDQEGTVGSAVISNQVADGLTFKDCLIGGQGKCNVKTQIPSKFFATNNPATLSITGVALIGFGPNPQPVRRLSMVPIRLLQSGDAQGEFRVEAHLVKTDLVAQKGNSGNRSSPMIGVVVGVIAAVGLTVGLVAALYWRHKKRRSSANQDADGDKAVARFGLIFY
jgi:hypothetical protein